MPATNRFFASTRGQILLRFLHEPGTVRDVAAELDISGNAARQHVTGLERDGYIERFREKPTGARPAAIYRVTPAGQALLPKAYEVVLQGLTDEMAEEYGASEAGVVIENLGHRFAAEWALPDDATTGERIDAAIERLEELGAIFDVQRFDETTVRLVGSGCPLGGLVGSHPEYCEMLATMLEDLTFQPVVVQCRNREKNPSCGFVIGANTPA